MEGIPRKTVKEEAGPHLCSRHGEPSAQAGAGGQRARGEMPPGTENTTTQSNDRVHGKFDVMKIRGDSAVGTKKCK